MRRHDFSAAKAFGKAQMATKRSILARENRGRTGKRTCKPVEREENHEKARTGRRKKPKWEISIKMNND